jgi:hypothetical protein
MSVTKKTKLALSEKGNHIIVTEIEFEDGFQTGAVKRALIEIDREIFPKPEEAFIAANQYNWSIDPESPQNEGWYSRVIRGAKKSEGQPKTADELTHS